MVQATPSTKTFDLALAGSPLILTWSIAGTISAIIDPQNPPKKLNTMSICGKNSATVSVEIMQPSVTAT
jgi:hypothetical protein